MPKKSSASNVSSINSRRSNSTATLPRPKQFVLDLGQPLVVDFFAGGGGASTGIEQGIGRHVDIAVNHDPEAISMHQVNHPQTKHYVSDVFEVDPKAVCGDKPVGLFWASADCTFFSRARGSKPFRDRNKARRRRGLIGVILRWAAEVRPALILSENVTEVVDWGPLLPDGTVCPARKGTSFKRWVARLRNLGYVVEWKELRGCDYGAPTIRKRLFIIARCDGQPIVWPEPTHAASPAPNSGLLPYRTAADCIDWSIPCPSIFERDKPLAEATQRRIAHGIQRYVLDNPSPYIVRIGQTGGHGHYSSRLSDPLTTVTTKAEHLLVTPSLIDAAHADVSPKGVRRWGKGHRSVEEPLQTITSSGGNAALASATLIQTGYGERPGQAPRVPGLHKPLGTTVDGQKHALVAAFLAKHYGGHEGPGIPVTGPVSTVTTQDHHHLVTTRLDQPDSSETAAKTKTPGRLAASNLVKLRGTSTAAATDEPLHTVSAGGQHHAEVRAFLVRYFGTDQDPRIDEPLATVTTKHRDALVTVKGESYVIADIGMRMLQPRELYRAQGFPEHYVIDRGHDGRPLSKASQVRMCGNSVCPPIASALVRANYVEQSGLRTAA